MYIALIFQDKDVKIIEVDSDTITKYEDHAKENNIKTKIFDDKTEAVIFKNNLLEV